MNTDAILKRADALLATIEGASNNPFQISEAYHGTLNLVRVVHGPASIHEAQLAEAMTTANRGSISMLHLSELLVYVLPAVHGALTALRADVAAGLTGNIALQASGVELGDFLTLAKQALERRSQGEKGEREKNAAAVLVAAAFEDALRRLAEAKANVTGRPDLEHVIGKLKAAGVLAGPSISIASSGLKFRNDSLHADWEHVDTGTIRTYLTFVEELLLKHFS